MLPGPPVMQMLNPANLQNCSKLRHIGCCGCCIPFMPFICSAGWFAASKKTSEPSSAPSWHAAWNGTWKWWFKPRIHVWYIYLHLVDFYGKCSKIYHTWILLEWYSFTRRVPILRLQALNLPGCNWQGFQCRMQPSYRWSWHGLMCRWCQSWVS